LHNDVVIEDMIGAERLNDWLSVPHTVFANDPYWVAPLRLSEKERVSPRHNPFFKFGDATFFIAYRNGTPVGRISAQVNRLHLEQHGDSTGHFGFFDCIDDPLIAQALVAAASSWLRARGLKKIRGPMSLTINQEIGVLVDGFHAPPAFMMPHATSTMGKLLETAGLNKAMDVLCYRMSPKDPPPIVERLANLARASDQVSTRHFNMRRFNDEVRVALDVFNDAWSENWGFVPFDAAEIEHLAKEMRPIMRGKFGRIVEINGEPAAMMVVLPDLNNEIATFNGRLLPMNWLKLATAIYMDKWKTARILLLGIRKKYRRSHLAPAILSMLVSDYLVLGREYDLDWVEFSWILETNEPMVKLAETAAGPACKRYRVYEGDIAG